MRRNEEEESVAEEHENFIERNTLKGRIHLVITRWKEHNLKCKERRQLEWTYFQAAWSDAVPCFPVSCHDKRSHGW